MPPALHSAKDPEQAWALGCVGQVSPLPQYHVVAGPEKAAEAEAKDEQAGVPLPDPMDQEKEGSARTLEGVKRGDGGRRGEGQ